jgi:hypothetical protein
VEPFSLSKIHLGPWGASTMGILKFNKLVVINSYDLGKKKNLCKGLR